jgi:hypothetical protein
MNFSKTTKVDTWIAQIDRLFRLRTDQIAAIKKAEIDHAVEYSIERLPPACRSMRLVDYIRSSNMTISDMNYLVFPPNYEEKRKKMSGSCQTTPPKRKTTQEHQTQTPVYTTHKRTRTEMENAELASKIRSQLAQEAQHVILPATGEYSEMPPNKKHQIVNILNAIVSTYEEIVAIDDGDVSNG